MKSPALFLAAALMLLSAAGRAQENPAPPLPPSQNVPLSGGEYLILTGGVSLMQWEKFKA